MTAHVTRRLLSSVFVIWGVVTFVFFLLHFVPGDPVDLMLGESALGVQREELRARLHLNEPVGKQYARYLAGAVRGDLGLSMASSESVGHRIGQRFPSTALLAAAALAFALILAIPLGVLSAAQPGGILDRAVIGFSLLGLAVPTFWIGPLFIYLFAFRFGWFPVSGRTEAASIVLPALTLGVGMASFLSRMIRATVLSISREDFVRTARAKGASSVTIWFRHIFRNALIPVITVVGLQAGALLAGAVITETVFSWPGIGLEMVRSIERRDYPVVQGCVLVIALSYVVVNLLADLLYGCVDPRVRREESAA